MFGLLVLNRLHKLGVAIDQVCFVLKELRVLLGLLDDLSIALNNLSFEVSDLGSVSNQCLVKCGRTRRDVCWSFLPLHLLQLLLCPPHLLMLGLKY